ncbi:MAG: TetR/AcrR family transcriptional regulator [Chrysiogenales bacterium]
MRHIAGQPNIRELILDGVDVMLARFGYRKMTMEDLARQVGIGKGTIYLHFPGKEELALAHIDRIVERLLLRLREISAGPDSPPERIRAMLVTRVLFRFDSVAHYSQNLNDLLSAVRKELLVRRRGHFEKEAQEFAKVLEAGREQGVFACPDSRSTAQLLIWSTNSMLPFNLTAQELGNRDELEERVSRLAGLLLQGLLRRPRDKVKPKKKDKTKK